MNDAAAMSVFQNWFSVNEGFNVQAQFQTWAEADRGYQLRRNYERELVNTFHDLEQGSALVGFCFPCGQIRTFGIDLQYGGQKIDGKPTPNWRERLQCEVCQLNNRTRASIQLLNSLGLLEHDVSGWIAEQTTPLFGWMSTRMPLLIGSEFLGMDALPGEEVPSGLRHEDATNTSFETGSLDLVLSFDVMEHIPNFEGAIREWSRILSPGGLVVWSAPFLLGSTKTRLRAIRHSNGDIDHIHPPQFHGDPVNPSEGILCYQEFGWDVLAMMRQLGFASAEVRLLWDANAMNIGPEQVFIIGTTEDSK